METPDIFKNLEVDGEIAIPSFVDALPLLELDKIADMSGVVSQQYQNIVGSYKGLGVSGAANMKGLTFLIPLTAYIPLPTPYHASIASRDNDAKELIGFTCVTIQHYAPVLSLGEKEVQLKMSYAIVTVAGDALFDISDKLEKMKILPRIYDDALNALNAVIHAYKSTPMRHSHIMQSQSALGSPGSVPILFTKFPDASVIEQETIMLHEHFLGELLQARDMSEQELTNFQATHVASKNGNSVPHWLVAKLNEAIDARCNGKDDSAVVFADLYTELSMRFLLYGVIAAKGETHKVAKARAQNHRNVDELVKDLAKELGKSPTTFKQDIGYAAWNQSCRKVRNKLNHEVERSKITPQQSFKAVDLCATIVRKAAEAVNGKYPGAAGDTQWLINAAWMTDSMKAANKKK